MPGRARRTPDGVWRSTVLHREMAYVGGTLYTSGGPLVLFAVLLGSWELYAERWVAAVGLVAIVVGVFFLWAAERLEMPLWQYAIATSGGAVLVTVAAVGGGPETTATFGVLYVFVTSYGFYYYPWPVAVWLVVLSGVGFAVALAWHDVTGAQVQWMMIVGAAVIAGGLIGSLGRQVRRLLALERVTVADLSETDRWKTTFLRAVSHDLRSPLGVVLGLLMLIRDRDADLSAEQRQELIGRSIDAGHRLQRLVEDLLDLERIAAGDIQPRLEPVRLDQLVADWLSETELEGRQVHVDVEPVTAAVEPARIERIFANLIGNALKHTPPEARIWVRVHADENDVIIRVEDDGPGLPDGVQEQLFDAFRQGDPARSGSVGLGLHLVHRFTEFHGGTVEATDRPAGGTRFEVHLPVRPNHEQETSELNAP